LFAGPSEYSNCLRCSIPETPQNVPPVSFQNQFDYSPLPLLIAAEIGIIQLKCRSPTRIAAQLRTAGPLAVRPRRYLYSLLVQWGAVHLTVLYFMDPTDDCGMKISIIVPIYNLEDCLGETLESVLSQDCLNFELIAVDDGSQETYKIVTTVRANSLEGLITNESPLGKALLGHKVGDVVTVVVNPTISYDVKIVDLQNTDDEGDSIRKY